MSVPWIGRRSNQSILKEVNPEYSLEGLMLMLELQYFGHLMQTANSLEKTLMLGKIEGKRSGGRADEEMLRWHHQLNGHEFEQTLGVKDREAWRAADHGVAKSGIQLSDGTTVRTGGFLAVPPLMSNCSNLPFGVQGRP